MTPERRVELERIITSTMGIPSTLAPVCEEMLDALDEVEAELRQQQCRADELEKEIERLTYLYGENRI